MHRELFRAACVCGVVATLGADAAAQAVAFTTTPSGWSAGAAHTALVATFSEALWPVNAPLPGDWSLNGVVYSGHAGTPGPNIYVIDPSPLSGPALTANGDEDIDLVLSPARSAVAFDVSVNPFGPVTVTVFDTAGTLIGTASIPAGTNGFIGAVSSSAIGRVNFRSVRGAQVDSLLDNVRLGDRACLADVDDGSGTGTPDGGVTIEDLLYYLALFAAGDVRGDIDDGSATGTPDGGVTIEDLLYFLARFAEGC